MTAARSIAQFADVQTVLDAAINHRGGKYRCTTRGEAIHWRQRAYSFRHLLRKQKLDASLIPGFDPGTPYDKLILRIPEEGDEHDTCVIIAYAEPRGIFEPANPASVTVPSPPSPVPGLSLEIADEIADLKRKLAPD